MGHSTADHDDPASDAPQVSSGAFVQTGFAGFVPRHLRAAARWTDPGWPHAARSCWRSATAPPTNAPSAASGHRTAVVALPVRRTCQTPGVDSPEACRPLGYPCTGVVLQIRRAVSAAPSNAPSWAQVIAASRSCWRSAAPASALGDGCSGIRGHFQRRRFLRCDGRAPR